MNKKNLIRIFFILVIIVSGVIYYVESTKNVDPPEPDIYQPLPSELETNESELEEVTVNNFRFKLAPDVDFAAERKKYNNNDIIARLEIPDLFNVLIVKGTDNSYYLNHSIKKEYDIRGTEFIDYRVNPTSKQVNIFGHNSRDPNIKVAFLKLEKYLDSNYMNQHPYIILQYEGGKSLYEIISIKEVDEGNNQHMNVSYTGEEFLKHMVSLTNNPGGGYSHYKRNVSYNADSEILVLQTCSHHKDHAVYIITAVKLNYIF